MERPTLVTITAEGPLAYPQAVRQTSTRVLLILGQDLTHDGVVLHLYGFLVQIEHPKPGEPLIAKSDVQLRASIRTLSGNPVRPHGDWDSRKLSMYGEVLAGGRVLERIQLFYGGSKGLFEAPFFVPRDTEVPDGLTLRIVAADNAGGRFGLHEVQYPVLSERLPPAPPR